MAAVENDKLMMYAIERIDALHEKYDQHIRDESEKWAEDEKWKRELSERTTALEVKAGFWGLIGGIIPGLIGYFIRK